MIVTQGLAACPWPRPACPRPLIKHSWGWGAVLDWDDGPGSHWVGDKTRVVTTGQTPGWPSGCPGAGAQRDPGSVSAPDGAGRTEQRPSACLKRNTPQAFCSQTSATDLPSAPARCRMVRLDAHFRAPKSALRPTGPPSWCGRFDPVSWPTGRVSRLSIASVAGATLRHLGSAADILGDNGHLPIVNWHLDLGPGWGARR